MRSAATDGSHRSDGRPAVSTGVKPVLAFPPLGRRRRPSGEPPPLPRRIDSTSRLYVALAAITALLWAGLSFRPALTVITKADLAVIRAVAHLRSGPLTTVMRGLTALGSGWAIGGVAVATIVALVAFRRARHLIAFVVIGLADVLLLLIAVQALGRMRPVGVDILTGWDGYSHPSRPVALLALVLAGAVHTLVPAGRRRHQAMLVAAVALGVLGAARVYLAVDHPSDVFAAIVVGWAVSAVAFRIVVPDEVFPVSYRRGRRAHLDVGGRRGEAIVTALDQQLGLDVTAIEPCGLAGSAGSTPLRLHVRRDDGSEDELFAKLYAVTHLRADRWYKLVRAALYGRLEDEKPFSTVRRLVEYEDHLLRLLRDAGLPTPRPYGFAEITPEREYVIVMEFFDGAEEIGAVDLDDVQIDAGLAIVRRMWDAGVAHRDIKPSNLLVRGPDVLLIDVAFGAARPTPWRQAVDLANMMLTLALASSPERVYERAQLVFAPDDIAEAFAASRSITVPTQLRARLRDRMRSDGTDVAGRLRQLAPARPPVAIQLWTVRRVAVTVAVAAMAAAAVILAIASIRVARAPARATAPACHGGPRLGLVAQSVPGATYVPCLAEVPEGWRVQSFRAERGRTRIALLSDRAAGRAVTVTLQPACNTAGATPQPTTNRPDGVRRFVRLAAISPRYRGRYLDVFPGGCVTWDFDLQRGPHIPLLEQLDQAVDLYPRRQLRLDIERQLDADLGPATRS